MTATWLADLPPLRGQLKLGLPMAPRTWFRVGGPAEAWYQPADADDLQTLLAKRPAELPVLPIGVASNLLVRDGGIPGIVLRLAGPLAAVEIQGDRLLVGAGATDRNIAQRALQAGLSGLEFLIGVPGTLGGAIRMNAGAFGGETAEIVERVIAFSPDGQRHELTAAELGFGYRHSALPEGWIVQAAVLKGVPGEPGRIRARMARIKAERAVAQPLQVATGGSTFKNPPGIKAWELIDRAGCRGLGHGRAMVSEKHCNFLINKGGATAAEIEELGELVRSRVQASSGVELDWEIHRVGKPADGAPHALEAAA